MLTQSPIQRTKNITEQVQDLLRERILQGIYPLGVRMPSEERLAQELDVSRATVRSALAAIASEGLIDRRHGDGTYPTPSILELSVRSYNAWNIELQIRQRGARAANRILAQGFREPTRQEVETLKLGEGEQVFSMRRLFLADELPVMLAIYSVHGGGLDPAFSRANIEGPFLEFLNRNHQRRMQSGAAHFKAVLAGEFAEILQVEPQTPLLLMEALVADEMGQPILVAREYYRGQEGFVLPIAPISP